MLNFFINNWKDIAEITISLIAGFVCGYTYKSIKIKSKIKGNNNTIIQNIGGVNDGK